MGSPKQMAMGKRSASPLKINAGLKKCNLQLVFLILVTTSLVLIYVF